MFKRTLHRLEDRLRAALRPRRLPGAPADWIKPVSKCMYVCICIYIYTQINKLMNK